MHQPVMPLQQPMAIRDFPPASDALVDKLTMTCHLAFRADFAGGVREVRNLLSRAGLVKPGAGGQAEVTFEWCCPLTGAMLGLAGKLTLTDGPDGSVLAKGGSRLEVNLLRGLRDQVETKCGPGLDGASNVVGMLEDLRPHLLAIQLETIAGLLNAFRDACEDASGSDISMDLWVRAVEFNRDLPRADAVEVAHRLAGECNPWHRAGWSRQYRNEADLGHDGNYAVVTWPNDRADAPIRMKFYAKLRDLLRIEVCLDNREAVLLCASQGDVAWPGGPATEGEGVAERLAILAAAVQPLLDVMATHVGRLDAPQREVLDLLAALAPLLRCSAPPPPRRPGARPTESTRLAARDALYHLLALGRFDASGLQSNSTVRKALHRIAAEGGLQAESRGRAALYTMLPSFAVARRALFRSMWPNAEGDEAT